VLIHLIISRPYKSRAQNFIQIFNETIIFTGYLFVGLFVEDVGIDRALHVWIVVSCVYLSYLLHVTVILMKLIRVIVNKINSYRTAAQPQTTLITLNIR
jgi:hypothetical protein